MMPPISRSPNDSTSAGAGPNSPVPSRVSAGAPAAPLRSAPRRPQPDPADTSTLAFLGSNPVDNVNGGAVGPEAGSAGMMMGAVASIAQGIQLLTSLQPGLVPPEIMQWTEQLMQIIPQVIAQQTSAMGALQNGGMQNPNAQLGPQAGMPGGMSSMGGAGGAGGVSGGMQMPQRPMGM